MDNNDTYKPSALFFATFLGELVEVVGGTGEDRIGIKGYLIDQDKEYFYLGPSKDRITIVVKKSVVDLISIEGELDEISELLHDISVPTDESEIN